MSHYEKFKLPVLLLAGVVLLSAFQNCSPVSFGPSELASTKGDNEPGTDGSFSDRDPSAEPVDNDITETIQKIKPSLAVRGLQCILCHGNFESNLVTDFGYYGLNFAPAFGPKPSFLTGDSAYGNARGSWQTAHIKGSVYIPAVQIGAETARNVFGNESIQTLKQALLDPSLGTTGQAMASAIEPAPGNEKVYERKTVVISYPTEAELLSLVPQGQRNKAIYFGPTANATAGSLVTGLALSNQGTFVRNSGQVTCRGDIVIKGTLFLNQLKLNTNNGGCRLYVTESVFIQGGIDYVGSGGRQNLQIASAQAIVMGFSARRLGASSVPGEVRAATHVDQSYAGTPGGPYVRLGRDIDERYEPGVPPAQRGVLADKIVLSAKKIGSELLDAADPALINQPPQGTRVEDRRLAVDYTGVILNAPHIHSRYAGSVKGIMIADIALFMLSSASENAHFIYDPIFDQVPAILPALPRATFSMSND